MGGGGGRWGWGFFLITFPCIHSELTALLSGSMSRVLEDYDASVCKELYSDDALPHITSSRSDAVSIVIVLSVTYIHLVIHVYDFSLV